MEENRNDEKLTEAQPPLPQYQPYSYTPPPRYVFPMGKKELLFAVGMLLFSLLLCNGLLYGGANLLFTLGLLGLMGGTFAYLRSHGHKPTRYAAAVLALCAFLAAGFVVSADGSLKTLMIFLLLVIPGMALCQMAGQNRRKAGGAASLLDGPRALLALGIGRMAESGRGIREACSGTGTIGKTGGAVILGLLLAVPVVAILIPLLMSADAAFEGLLDLLPEFRWDEVLCTLILGTAMGYEFYTRGAALQHLARQETPSRTRKGLSPITVNTVLIAVGIVYIAYLVSQLAYFVGGFAGILPQEYTLAEYARRGFFEMAWLCAINLAIIAGAMALVTARGKAPLLTRLICLFLGVVTLFLVATASAKMFLYIGSYGLTRLRVLTEVFMVWLGLTTGAVCLWIFRPRIAYMKFAVLLGLAFCAALMWADVDGTIARYNVRAYQTGKLASVDVYYLRELNLGAIPYIEELTGDADGVVAKKAEVILTDKARHYAREENGLRNRNLKKHQALKLLEKYRVPEMAEAVGDAQQEGDPYG